MWRIRSSRSWNALWKPSKAISTISIAKANFIVAFIPNPTVCDDADYLVAA